MLLAKPRTGDALTVMQRELEFSQFMMRRTSRRWGLSSMLYAAEPWAVMSGSVTDLVAAGGDREAALSFVRQAREYFTAAERASTVETRPLLYYYCFLNLGKALSITLGRRGMVGKVDHGVHHLSASGHAPATSRLGLRPSTPKVVSALDELHRALEKSRLPTPAGGLAVWELMAQSVVAHRLWREAANRKERFLTIEHISLLHNEAAKIIWATLHVRKDTMVARGRTISETLTEAGLAPGFRAVSDCLVRGAVCRSFEQTVPLTYSGRSADRVMDLVAMLRPLLWQTVTSAPPYRRYYLYLCPQGEQRHPQWLTIYCILFWLGSMTRYYPVALIKLLEGPYGPFLREFLETQPSQLLYTLASEFKRQDVSRAAVV